MKLHDPVFERSLENAVRTVLAKANPREGGGGLLKEDGFRRALNKGGAVFFGLAGATFVLLLLLGVNREEVRTPGCLNVVVGLWFLIWAGLIRTHVLRESFHTNEAKVFWMLPIQGEPILWRAVRRSFFKTWPMLLQACVACVWLKSITGELAGTALAGGLLSGAAVWFMTLAIAAVEVHTTLANRLGNMWLAVTRAAQIALGLLAISTIYQGTWQPIHDWFEMSAPVLLWILPPAWITSPLTEFSFGPKWIPATFAVVLITAGMWRWLQWPKTAAGAYDSLPEEPEENDDEDTWAAKGKSGFDARRNHAEEAESSLAEALRGELGQNEAESLLADGWIQRRLLRFLSKREQAVLPVLMRNAPSWSKRWKSALVGSLEVVALILILNWGRSLAHFSEESWGPVHDDLNLVAGWFLAILLLIHAVPIGGDVSDAVRMWPGGAQPLPFMCGFPVVSGDLLRASWKIVMVRTALAALLAAPLAWFLGWQYDGTWRTGMVAASLAGRALWLLVCARPMMIIFRMGKVTKWGSGFWLWRFASSMFLAVLFFIWLATAGVFLAFAAADSGMAQPVIHAWLLNLMLGLAPLLLSLAMFWWFWWRLRRRGLDFGTQG